ncbi:hypothetical protein FKM82_006289 [Ascaphus truei]
MLSRMQDLKTELRETFHTELDRSMDKFKTERTALGERTDTVERSLEGIHQFQREAEQEILLLCRQVDTLFEKAEDSENRSRRNNLCIQNISEEIDAVKLEP